MLDTELAARRRQQLKGLGILLAIDDFGTGYSSLAYLQRFPVDCLKIDRTFTNAIGTTPESAALIRTLVQLGSDLGLKTFAEGVETTGEVDHLRNEHVDHAQSFLMAPTPATRNHRVQHPRLGAHGRETTSSRRTVNIGAPRTVAAGKVVTVHVADLTSRPPREEIARTTARSARKDFHSRRPRGMMPNRSFEAARGGPPFGASEAVSGIPQSGASRGIRGKIMDDAFLLSIDAAISRLRNLRKVLDRREEGLMEIRRQGEAGLGVAEIISRALAGGIVAVRREVGRAYLEYSRAATAERAAAIRLCIDEEGRSVSEVARSWDISRQMADRLYHLTTGGVVAEETDENRDSDPDSGLR
jgi:hypothetical protein